MTKQGAIDGRTLAAAVFGDPVEHSLSPAMHNAAYRALGVNRVYIAFRVRPADLEKAISAIPALGIIGVNLTVPHKERAAELVERLSREAQMLGAVNCIVNRGGRLYGDNTDARGLERDLRRLGVRLRGRAAVVIGAGGGAAAAVLACARLGAKRIVIANRTAARARSLARRLARFGIARGRIVARGLDALTDASVLGGAGLVINATPMGLLTRRFAQMNCGLTPRSCLFYDLVYSKTPTPLVRLARKASRRSADGAGMLVAQGELAFRLFNGVTPPRGAMRAALSRALDRRLRSRT
ncbi:MAG: shikimate dehydrogenase [Candidatus Binataceae bacterium]